MVVVLEVRLDRDLVLWDLDRPCLALEIKAFFEKFPIQKSKSTTNEYLIDYAIREDREDVCFTLNHLVSK